MKRLSTICLLTVIMISWCSRPVLATTYTVNPGESIQAAINAASYGDMVEVAAGTYTECITLKNGVALIGSGASVTTIDDNQAGTVVSSNNCDPNTVLDGFTITRGKASFGGGMYNEDSSPTVTNCTFSNNSAKYGGGGMYNYENSSPMVTNCTFIDNEADFDGGGMYNFALSGPTVINCTFSGNSVHNWGGGMCNYESSPTVINCTFIDNYASDYSCSFSGCGTGSGGGIYNYESSPTVTNCTFIYNFASGYWYMCSFDYPCYGGGGGGMYNDGGCGLTITNCTFIENGAGIYGGGMFNDISSSMVINCTFSHNYTWLRGGGIFNLGSGLTVTNCILWDDWSYYPDEISCFVEYGRPMVTYSDVMGGWWGPGTGNINTDPLFADADENDFHLKSQAGRWNANSQSWEIDSNTSPCIDAGDWATPVGLEPFPNGGRVNMGAYGGTVEASKSYFGTEPCEIIVAGDINGDCIVNFLDLAIMALHWQQEEK